MLSIQLIEQERQRQTTVEGFDSDHDDTHNSGELVNAAACYAALAQAQAVGGPDAVPHPAILTLWPWDKEWWKPSQDPVRNLVKAAALLAAEIDRLQRLG